MPPKLTGRCVRYQVDEEMNTSHGQPGAETSRFDLSGAGAKIGDPETSSRTPLPWNLFW